MASSPDAFDLLLADARTPDQEAALQRALAQDPALAEAASQWQTVRQALRQRLDHDLPDRDLLVLYALDATGRRDELTEEERSRLRTHTPLLREVFAAHPALHDVVEHVATCCADFDRCWAAAWRQAPRTDRAPRSSARSSVPGVHAVQRWGWRIGAALAVVAFGVLVVLMQQREAALLTATTEAGEVQVIELADGSTVRLMERSRLVYPDPAQETVLARRAHLEGRAFFEVEPMEVPFIVETPTAVTTVLGTSFGVEADGQATEVVLAAGRVAVAPKEAADRQVILEPGQQSRVAAGALPSTPTEVDLTEVLAWSGRLYFQATPLADVAARLAAHYGVPVTYAPALEAESLTGTAYLEDSLDINLRNFATTLGATVEPLPGGGFRLTK